MKSKIAYLFTNPTPHTLFSNYHTIPTDAFIIGVDGGTNELEILHHEPELIIGDMDSILSDVLAKYETQVPILKYSTEKDETDCELAIRWCIDNKFREIVIVNSLEGRFDHVMGLIQNLLYATLNGLKARIESKKQQIFFLEKDQIISSKKGMRLSLIPFSPVVKKVKTEGLVFALNEEDLFQYQTRCISNQFQDDTARIQYIEGDLLAILTL
jgi:thiamine pyrophosphokinase